MRSISIAKIGEGLINEDAAKATEKWIAVSDGAGGGGVFADLWSKYLVENLPDEAIADYQNRQRRFGKTEAQIEGAEK